MEHTTTQMLLAMPQWVSMAMALIVMGGVSGAWLIYKILAGRINALEMRLDRMSDSEAELRDKAGQDLKSMLDDMRTNCKARAAACSAEYISREAALAAIDRTRDDMAHKYELILSKLDHLAETWHIWARRNGVIGAAKDGGDKHGK